MSQLCTESDVCFMPPVWILFCLHDACKSSVPIMIPLQPVPYNQVQMSTDVRQMVKETYYTQPAWTLFCILNTRYKSFVTGLSTWSMQQFADFHGFVAAQTPSVSSRR